MVRRMVTTSTTTTHPLSTPLTIGLINSGRMLDMDIKGLPTQVHYYTSTSTSTSTHVLRNVHKSP